MTTEIGSPSAPKTDWIYGITAVSRIYISSSTLIDATDIATMSKLSLEVKVQPHVMTIAGECRV